MTTVTERRKVQKADDQIVGKTTADQDNGKMSGILKGGKLWKSTESNNLTDLKVNPKKVEESNINIDEDGKRSVRFSQQQKETKTKDTETETDASESVENASDLSLALKVDKHVIALNSSKPNSAVSQLFPNRSPVSEDDKKYLVTSESLKLFEEAKKSKLQQYYSCRNKDSFSRKLGFPQDLTGDDDVGLQSNLIKRTIERNTLRRGLLKYPHDIKFKSNQRKMKNESSLIEKIRHLTCDFDDDCNDKETNKTLPVRTSPLGEECEKPQGNQNPDKVSSTNKNLTDLFTRQDKCEASHPSALQNMVSIGHQYLYYQPVYHQTSPPDLGNGLNSQLIGNKTILKHNITAEARKQFISSLAPLTASVVGNVKEKSVNNNIQLNQPGERNSVASTSTAAETEYSLDDIEEALSTGTNESNSQVQPEVVTGTPTGKSEQDELALFVQQDAGRLARIRKRYGSTPSSAGSDDDENDDCGFNRRPSVRGIKPRFGSTTEILQEMQPQVQPPSLTCPSRVTWPYYTFNDVRTKGNRGFMPIVKEEPITCFPNPNYANTSVDGRRNYQIYSSTGNLHQPFRIGGGGDMQYRPRSNHFSESHARVPPEGMMLPFQDADYQYRPTAIHSRRASPDSVVQMKDSPGHQIQFKPHYVESESHYSTQTLPLGKTSIIPTGQQQAIRIPYTIRGPEQKGGTLQKSLSYFQKNRFVIACDTETTYYHVPSSPCGTYNPPPPQPLQNAPKYNGGSLIFLEKLQNKIHNNKNPNNSLRASSPILSVISSPTRIKPLERGIPEGAASSSPGFPQDNACLHSSPTKTSPPGQDKQAPTHTDIWSSPSANLSTQSTASPVFYAMNV